MKKLEQQLNNTENKIDVYSKDSAALYTPPLIRWEPAPIFQPITPLYKPLPPLFQTTPPLIKETPLPYFIPTIIIKPVYGEDKYYKF